MKKFLFTLAALLMAGSLCATEYLYIEDFEVTQDQLGKNITVPMKAHFEAAVSAAQVNMTFPEGMVLRKIDKGSSIASLTYCDDYGDEWTADNTIFTPAVPTSNFAFATVDKGYYEVDGEWVYYGAVKFMPGEYDEMALITIRVNAEFTGGEIVVETMPSCGADARPWVETCDKTQDNFMTCVVTVEGVEPQLQDLAGTIEIASEADENGLLAISYNGTEEVTIVVTVNGEVAELVDGMVQLAEGENNIVVTVSAEGYNDLVATASVTYTAPVPPTQTDKPEITTEETDEAVIVTATGNGTVILYCDGAEVENPCTIMKGDAEQTFTFTATAQVEGEELSEVAELVVVVPAKEVGPEPEDPHMQGYWLVLVEHDGNLNWIQLVEGANKEYTTAYDVTYPLHWDLGHFYYMVNGVAYGAEADETEAVFGYANANPLVEGTNTYTVPVGYRYQIGLNFIIDQDTDELIGYAAYVAQGNPVSVDELVNGKTVAGVRYFNMAGQEMQEANGMTIVVTTYTDGTTSAVKVMK